LVLALIVLAAGLRLASLGPSISYLAADYLDVSSPASDEASPPPLLFDMETEQVVEGAIPDKWHRVKTDIAGEFEALRRCLEGHPCPPAARRLLDISAEGAGRVGRARVGLINRAVDMAISPTSDERQWGEADRWSTPFETLQSRRGDCEDYAIPKYVALLAAGVPAADVKVVILKHLLPREDHAAVAARVDGEWLILDNLTLTLVRDTDLARTIPEFVLDQDGVRRFLWSSRSRRSTRAS
jgi:predicted transglutaminase-like cysteine proteinase